jgi:hypothetical protein
MDIGDITKIIATDDHGRGEGLSSNLCYWGGPAQGCYCFLRKNIVLFANCECDEVGTAQHRETFSSPNIVDGSSCILD